MLKKYNKQKKKFNLSPYDLQMLKLFKGLCLLKSNNFEEGDRIFQEYYDEEEKTEIIIDLDDLKILENFAYSLGRYRDLREILERNMDKNDKIMKQKLLEILLKE